MSKLNIKKATGNDNLPPKIVKLCAPELAPYFTSLLNRCIVQGVFPENMRKAEIVPVFKKNDKLIKFSYRPVSILTILSKIFEQLLTAQLSAFFENIFDNMMSAYRKGFSCQNVLIKLVESGRQGLDSRHYIGSVMMNLSQAFDCMPRALLI